MKNYQVKPYPYLAFAIPRHSWVVISWLAAISFLLWDFVCLCLAGQGLNIMTAFSLKELAPDSGGRQSCLWEQPDEERAL